MRRQRVRSNNHVSKEIIREKTATKSNGSHSNKLIQSPRCVTKEIIKEKAVTKRNGSRINKSIQLPRCVKKEIFKKRWSLKAMVVALTNLFIYHVVDAFSTPRKVMYDLTLVMECKLMHNNMVKQFG